MSYKVKENIFTVKKGATDRKKTFTVYIHVSRIQKELIQWMIRGKRKEWIIRGKEKNEL